MSRLATVLICLLAATAPARACQLQIAAAASLTLLADELEDAFRSETRCHLSVTLGASGVLSSQIIAGAPFSVFLSADEIYPQKLVENRRADPQTLQPYADGRLGLWVPNHSSLSASSAARLLASSRLKRLAVASPEVAPYGAAALEVLQSLGLSEAYRDRLVKGESVSQAAHLARAGAADAALLSLSLRSAPELARNGRWVELPDGLHTPVRHTLVIIHESAEAERFVRWLLGPSGRRLLVRHHLAPIGRAETP